MQTELPSLVLGGEGMVFSADSDRLCLIREQVTSEADWAIVGPR